MRELQLLEVAGAQQGLDGLALAGAKGGVAEPALAAIDQPDVIRGILDCLGLNSRAPPLTPAHSPEPTDLKLGFEEPWPSDEPDDDG